MNISKLYKRIKLYSDRDSSKLYITPFREWSIMLFLSTIITIIVIFFCYGAFNDIYTNSFKEEGIGQAVTDPYKIEDIKIELSKTLQYYKKQEREYDALLEKQPIFENKVNIIKSSDFSDPQDDIEELKEEADVLVEPEPFEEDIDVLTEPESSEEEPILEVLDHIQSNFSNAASVLKAFFVDPFK